MNQRQREVIVACDYADESGLRALLTALRGERPYLKVGMELYYRCGAPLVERLKGEGYKIFLDLKLHDIPHTVYRAMKQLMRLRPDIVNVHAAGGIEMMRAARRAADEADSGDTLVVAVTQLTSTDADMLSRQLLIETPMAETVRHYAENARTAGLDGVVCSGREAAAMRQMGLVSVTPGIRFAGGSADDQKRVMTPAQAHAAGSDYIVIGRAVTGALDPKEAYGRAVREFATGRSEE